MAQPDEIIQGEPFDEEVSFTDLATGLFPTSAVYMVSIKAFISSYSPNIFQVVLNWPVLARDTWDVRVACPEQMRLVAENLSSSWPTTSAQMVPNQSDFKDEAN